MARGARTIKQSLALANGKARYNQSRHPQGELPPEIKRAYELRQRGLMQCDECDQIIGIDSEHCAYCGKSTQPF